MAVTQSKTMNDDKTMEDDEPRDIPKDDIFHLLQNERRRRVLEYLSGRDGEKVEMRELAEQVAAWEHDTTVRQLTSDERQRVYIALYQSHLPKLDKAGVIEYNQSRGIVRRTPLADSVETYLDTPADDASEEPDADPTNGWLAGYGIATTVCAALVAVTAFVSASPALLTALAAGVTAVFGALTAFFAWRSEALF